MKEVSKLKKFLTIVLGALFVLSFAASAFAIHAEIPSETQAVVAKGTTQITLGGELRIRGWWEHNRSSSLPLGDSGTGGDSDAWYDYRVRLSLDAQISPNVQGFVQLESNGGTSDLYVMGTNSWNAKPTDLHILQAWMLYQGSGLFGVPAGLKIGHMPISLGEKQFYDHTKFGDDAIVAFINPTKALHIAGIAIKAIENTTSDNTDDADIYMALATYNIDGKNTVGVNYTYLNQNDAGPAFPLDTKLHNIGVHANGKIGGFGYKAEADYQFGDVMKVCVPTGPTTCRVETIDAGGWGVLLGVNYAINPVNIRAGFAYGSGDGDATDGDFDEFITFLGADQHHALIYGYRLVTAAMTTSGLGGRVPTGIANTTQYNIGVDYNATKDLKFKVDGWLFRASKTGAIEDIVGKGVSSKIGWEVDAGLSYNVAKNLKYAFDIGYFDANDFYNDAYGIKEKGTTVIRHGLTLSF